MTEQTNLLMGPVSQVYYPCNEAYQLNKYIDDDFEKIAKICLNEIDQIINMCYDNSRKKNTKFSLNLNECYKIIQTAGEILKKEPPVLKLSTSEQENSEIIILGDIHGNLDILVRIFSSIGYPSQKRFLFLGDYVDRGSNSCEVMILLYSYKILYPDNIYLIRGNHEFKEMASSYGFKRECYNRIDQITWCESTKIYECLNFFDKVTDTFQYMPICAILNDSVFCVHGGITALIDSPEKLTSIQKVGTEFTSENSVQVEFMWNDPDNDIEYCYEHSPRGIGCLFNQEALESFLKTMNFSMVIRGHQMCNEGFDYPFGKDGGIMTVFSSANYCGEYNRAAVATLKSKENNQWEVETSQFELFELEKKNIIITPPEIFLNINPLCKLDDIPINDINESLRNIPIYVEC